jgi:hypothetical protein
LTSREFATRLAQASTPCGTFAEVSVKLEYPLDSLLYYADSLVDEVGKFFTWAWPLFEASRTGRWRG